MATCGIDLGTTYSVIATSNNSVVRVFLDSNSAEQTVPSVVYHDPQKGFLVGKTAKKMLAVKPASTVEHVKRYMEPDPQARDWAEFKREIDGTSYDAVDISTEILKHMGSIVKDTVGEYPTDVVITIPAYFGIRASNWTKQAGEQAGFNVLDIVPEPTAAAIYYASLETPANRTSVVFDLGGGTYDVSIVKTTLEADENGNLQPHLTVLAYDGNRSLGGVDWDRILLNMVKKIYAAEQGISESDITKANEAKMYKEIEMLKIDLSTLDSSEINFTDDQGNDCCYTITRADFEAESRNLVLATEKGLDQVLAKAGLTIEDIDVVYLVGGSTMMPMIKNMVEAKFPDKNGAERVVRKDPHLAVASGAAIYAENIHAYTLSKKVEDDHDEDDKKEDDKKKDDKKRPSRLHMGGTGGMLTRSFGIGVYDSSKNGKMVLLNLALINTKLPCTTSTANIRDMYLYVSEDYPELSIPVYESLSPKLSECNADSIDLPLRRDENTNEEMWSEVIYENNTNSIVYVGDVIIKIPGNIKPKEHLTVEMDISIGRVITIRTIFESGIVAEGELDVNSSRVKK